jgi:uncharacterized membrane protein YfcA
MLQVYLPVAEMSVNLLVMLALGAAVGFLSGMFGVGGGFLMTPLLIFSGIPPVVAVATEANQIVASSVSGVLAQWRRKNVDLRMGTILLIGGIGGSFIGVWLIRLLREIGQVDLMISISYVTLLGGIGGLMLVESLRAISAVRQGRPASMRRPGQHNWIQGLPFKMRFKRSKLYISAIPPFLIGTLVGLLAAMMGVGGGFIMVPAMIYLLRMPTNVVVGTSLFQIIFVTGAVTILQATTNQAVDVVLAMSLAVGGVIGAQIGARSAQRLRAEQLRLLLAFMVLAVAIRLFAGLVMTPEDLYSLSEVTGGE